MNSRIASEGAGVIAVLHTSVSANFQADDISPVQIFGGRSFTKAGMDTDGNDEILSGLIEIKKPFVLEVDDLSDAEMLVRILVETGHKFAEAGFDGVQFKSAAGSAWVVLNASQIKPTWRGPPSKTHDAHEFDEETWIGPSMISEIFEIDGRSEEFEHLFEAMEEGGCSYPVLSDQDDWKVCWLDDWEPTGTVGLLDPSGTPKGFYMGGMAWVDEDARGAGHAISMILATADILGGPPSQNIDGLGYSDAGYSVHLAALRAAQEMAAECELRDENDFDL